MIPATTIVPSRCHLPEVQEWPDLPRFNRERDGVRAKLITSPRPPLKYHLCGAKCCHVTMADRAYIASDRILSSEEFEGFREALPALICGTCAGYQDQLQEKAAA